MHREEIATVMWPVFVIFGAAHLFALVLGTMCLLIAIDCLANHQFGCATAEGMIALCVFGLVASNTQWLIKLKRRGTPVIPSMRKPGWIARRELAACWQEGVCPDCAKKTLDRVRMVCNAEDCGSRFHRDPNTGAWSRL